MSVYSFQLRRPVELKSSLVIFEQVWYDDKAEEETLNAKALTPRLLI